MKVIKTKRLTGMLGCLLVLVLTLSLATPVMAVPQIPHAFYGSVTVGDEPAPDDIVVSAEINGVEYARTTTLEGKYGYSPTFKVPGDDPETPEVEGGVEGDTIEFYIRDVRVDTYTFTNGEVTQLDLSGTIQYKLTVSASPAAGGTVSGSGTYDCGTNQPITATPANECWYFVDWTGEGITDPDVASTTVIMDEDKTVTASFAKYQYKLTVSASPAAGGTVSGSGTYDCGTNQPITATAAAGYKFTSWTGEGIANPSSQTTTVRIDRDKTVTANFSAERKRRGGGTTTVSEEEEETPPGTTDVRGMVGTGCRFTESVSAISELCTLTIPEGTVGLTEELECLAEITMLIMEEPPPPPEDAHVIGLIYDFQPSGATFEPAITLTWNYDPSDIPEGIAEEDLVIAYYDEAADEWVELDCVVDTENKTITASVEHFTTFAIIGAVTPPQEEEVVPPPEEEEEVPPVEEEEVAPLVEEEEAPPAEEEEEVPPVEEEEEVAPLVEEEEAPPAEEEEEVPPSPVPTPWGLIGGIIAGVIVVGLIIFFMFRRRVA